MDFLKRLFTKEEPNAKELATQKKEPWVTIVKVELNPDNPGQGSFELDWNEHFIKWLKQNGYKGNSDESIVDQWFQQICHYVALDAWENYDPSQPLVRKKRIDATRSEYS
jgi:hypothetical protein